MAKATGCNPVIEGSSPSLRFMELCEKSKKQLEADRQLGKYAISVECSKQDPRYDFTLTVQRNDVPLKDPLRVPVVVNVKAYDGFVNIVLEAASLLDSIMAPESSYFMELRRMVSNGLAYINRLKKTA